MRARLFEDLVVSAPPAGRLGRRAAVFPLSIAAHAGALAAALLLPALRPAELPSPLLPERPIVDWGPPPTTLPSVVATPAPTRLTKAPPSRSSAPATVSDPDIPPPAPGPTVSMIEPNELLPEDGRTPCFVNCERADPNGTGNGLDRPPGTAGTHDGTGPGLVRAGGDIKPPIRTVYVAPVYPEIASRARVSGVVVVECTIDPSGQVTDARVITGHPLLDRAALDAVRQWRYTATRLNGVPVAVLMTVTVRFTVSR
jgi:protein TonB